MRNFILMTFAVIGLTLAAPSVFAGCGSCGSDDKASCDEKGDHHSASMTRKSASKLVVNINGMACEACAGKIEEKFSEKTEVKGAKVDLKTKTVEITFNEGKTLDDKTVASLITSAGFEYKGTKTN